MKLLTFDAGCEEWWFGGVGCEKGNKSVTQCDICDHVSSWKYAVAHPTDWTKCSILVATTLHQLENIIVIHSYLCII